MFPGAESISTLPPFVPSMFNALYALAKKGIAELIEAQKQALGKK